MTNKNSIIFTIAHQYSLYLQRMGLSEKNMHPEQKKQLKESFYGAWGQCLISLRDDVGALPDEDAMDVMEAQIKEVGDYFLKITNQKN